MKGALRGGAEPGGFRVLVCGDRNWRARARITGILARLKAAHPDAEIVHGANGYDASGRPSFLSGRLTVRGADMMAHEEAERLGMPTHPEPADWDAHGKAAGPIRNQTMLDKWAPEMVLAFHDNFGTSKGTKDMLERAVRAGIPAHVLTTHADAATDPPEKAQLRLPRGG